MAPLVSPDLRSQLKQMLQRCKPSRHTLCTQHESFVYNLNERIWSESFRGIRKPITFSRDPNCAICSGVRSAFVSNYGCSAGEFDDDEPFRLDSYVEFAERTAYMLWLASRDSNGTRSVLYLLPLDSAADRTVGRVVKPLVDTDLVVKWINSCETWHGHSCDIGNHHTPVNVSTFRVIDVVDGCLTTVSANDRYIALSYVWGTVQTLHTLKANLAHHEKPGAFFEHSTEIPKTIADAIELVRRIGERYLWVDALCIVQDDSESKMTLIDNMDQIYQNAIFTIVAATGTNSQAGLPGVSSPRLTPQQVLLYDKNRRIAIAQRPFSHALDQNSVSEPSLAIWNKRAWTHQERLLSGRKLIFLEDGVHFNCQRMTWTEDTDVETIDITRHFQMYDFENISIGTGASNFGPPSMKPRKKDVYTLRGAQAVFPNFIEYCRLVDSHMSRDLTFEQDVLVSFQGILNSLAHTFGNFSQGLPDSFFSLALLWQPKDFCQRRKWKKESEAHREVIIPSWTWAGWKCDIELGTWAASCDFQQHDDMQATYRVIPNVEIKAINRVMQSARPVEYEISDTWAQYRELEQNPETHWPDDIRDTWDCRRITSHFYCGRQRHYEFLPHRDPSLFFLYPIPLPKYGHLSLPAPYKPTMISRTLLSFRTEIATLRISSVAFSYGDKRNAVSVVDDETRWCGIIVLNEKLPLSSGVTFSDLVKISEGEIYRACIEPRIFPEKAYVPANIFYRFVNVLLTAEIDSIRFRVGIGRVLKDAWVQSGIREDDILLG